ncbi:MAG: ABC transporter ATP-binding protein/permease [Alphaproteobacteria bacterium]|nr:ABC transporter ATP-binding protein/permease [Alphaproteobacteria bacterium]MBT5389271.1 ABC transporter ATP-binding protein/permease [Alphaproteobacteria bacterium]
MKRNSARIAGIVFFITLSIFFNLLTPLFLKETVSYLESNNTSIVLLYLLAAYGIIWGASKITTSLREFFAAPLAETLVKELIKKTFSHIHKQSMLGKNGMDTGNIVSIIERIKFALPALVWGLALLFFPLLFEISISMIILWNFFGYSYALVFLCTLSFFILFSSKGTKKALDLKREGNSIDLSVSSLISDSILNHETLRYLSTQKHINEKLSSLLDKREKAKVLSLFKLHTTQLLQDATIGVGFLILMIFSGLDLLSSQIKISDLVLINGYLLQILSPLASFGILYKNAKSSLVDLEKVFELLSSPIRPTSHKEQVNTISLGKIEFQNVCFSYPHRSPLIKKLSFTLPPGTRTALIGTSGAGKTTLIKLLFQFYDCNSGKILIDDKDLSTFSPDVLSKEIGIVPQDSIVFNESIYENIIHGSPIPSEQKLEDILEAISFSDLKPCLPNGLNTIVGERGVKLSGGEKQRIILARLLLKAPSILIFDEATANLDSISESSVQNAIMKLSKNKTILNITHNFNQLDSYDNILVLQNGSLVEEGTHSQLLEKKGHYQKLWNTQNKTLDIAS